MSTPDLLETSFADISTSSAHVASELTAITYWWGYEIYFPQPLLNKLESEGDVATGVLYFLGALSRAVPVIYPFVNTIATYVALQFTVIRAMDQGSGVVLMATWVLPILLIPKPWEEGWKEKSKERASKPFGA